MPLIFFPKNEQSFKQTVITRNPGSDRQVLRSFGILTTIAEFACTITGLGIAFVISNALVVFIDRFTYTLNWNKNNTPQTAQTDVFRTLLILRIVIFKCSCVRIVILRLYHFYWGMIGNHLHMIMTLYLYWKCTVNW